MLAVKRLAVLFTALLLVQLFSHDTQAETWPQFRGVTGDGVSVEKNLPIRWSKDQGVLWSVDLPGRANSSPAVTKNRIDLTTQEKDNSLWVISIDRKTGRLTNRVKVGSGTLVAKGPANLYTHRHNAATPSPAADENNIWAFFGTGLLVCVDASGGSIRWRRDLVQDYGPYDITFGMGSSPRVWGDLVYVNCMTKGASYVVALDKRTGKEVWRASRRLPAKDDGPDAYSTPTVFRSGGGLSLLVSGSDHINAYDLLTGKQLWISSGLDIDSPYGRIIASPVGIDGVVVATSGNPGGGGKGHVIAVSADGKGDVTDSHRIWEYPRSTPDSSSPVCLDGKVYMITDAGVGSCIDVKSGRLAWTKRLGKGPFHASTVAGDGKIYFVNIEGTCVVLEAGKAGKTLATNKLPGTFYATPAISDGVIYLRAYERLYAIGSNQ